MPSHAALLIIDVQDAIDHPKWAAHGSRNNLQAEEVISRLLKVWRSAGRRIFHIRHESSNPTSTYYFEGAGGAFKTEAMPQIGEAVITKRVHSAFIGTDLEAQLRAAGIDALVVAGVITNNSVETTVRMAANLGFDVRLVEDGCFTFARPDYSGRLRTAEEVHAMSLANLHGEYCTVVRADDVC